MESHEITQAFLNLRAAHEIFVHSVFETQSETIEEIYSSAGMLLDAFQYDLAAPATANYRARLDYYIDELVRSNPVLTDLETNYLTAAQEMYEVTHGPYWSLPGAGVAFNISTMFWSQQ